MARLGGLLGLFLQLSSFEWRIVDALLRIQIRKVSVVRRRSDAAVPADAFYEWKVLEAGKQPYAIARQDGQPMAFAAPIALAGSPGGFIPA
jgi:hypothetical protein